MNIYVFGHNKGVFKTRESLIDFIVHGMANNGNRYRWKKIKRCDPDIIVLSYDGWAVGHLEISGKEKPNAQDLKDFPDAKCTYIAAKREIYNKPMKLYSQDIRNNQSGVSITQNKFESLYQLIGGSTTYA